MHVESCNDATIGPWDLQLHCVSSPQLTWACGTAELSVRLPDPISAFNNLNGRRTYSKHAIQKHPPTFRITAHGQCRHLCQHAVRVLTRTRGSRSKHGVFVMLWRSVRPEIVVFLVFSSTMDHKRSPIRRTKRQAKVLEDNFWDCSVCTYRNTAEAFKCMMCDVRKGTSTRKPRINPQLVAQQVASQFLPATSNQKREKKDKRSLKKRRHPPRLKNIDRSTAQTREVTVNSVTVVITEYKPKMKSSETISSSSSSDHGSHSESSMDAAR